MFQRPFFIRHVHVVFRDGDNFCSFQAILILKKDILQLRIGFQLVFGRFLIRDVHGLGYSVNWLPEDCLTPRWKYSVFHNFISSLIFALIDGNHENWVPVMLTHNLWMILMGMKEKKSHLHFFIFWTCYTFFKTWHTKNFPFAENYQFLHKTTTFFYQ